MTPRPTPRDLPISLVSQHPHYQQLQPPYGYEDYRGKYLEYRESHRPGKSRTTCGRSPHRGEATTCGRSPHPRGSSSRLPRKRLRTNSGEYTPENGEVKGEPTCHGSVCCLFELIFNFIRLY
jgi:hypothetical protein